MLDYKGKVLKEWCGMCFIKHQYSNEYVPFSDFDVKGVFFKKEVIWALALY